MKNERQLFFDKNILKKAIKGRENTVSIRHREIVIELLTKMSCELKSKVDDYKKTIEAQPISELIDLRKQILSRKNEDYKTLKQHLDKAVKREYELRQLIDKQDKYFKLEYCKKMVDLEFAISDINRIICDYSGMMMN